MNEIAAVMLDAYDNFNENIIPTNDDISPAQTIFVRKMIAATDLPTFNLLEPEEVAYLGYYLFKKYPIVDENTPGYTILKGRFSVLALV